MRMHEASRDLLAPSGLRIESDAEAQRSKVASLSAAVVDSMLSSCKAAAVSPEICSERASSCSGSLCWSAELCTLDPDRPGWDCLPAPALEVIGKGLPVRSLASARVACKAWSATLNEALIQSTPSTFLSGPSQPAGKRNLSVVHNIMHDWQLVACIVLVQHM